VCVCVCGSVDDTGLTQCTTSLTHCDKSHTLCVTHTQCMTSLTHTVQHAHSARHRPHTQCATRLIHSVRHRPHTQCTTQPAHTVRDRQVHLSVYMSLCATHSLPLYRPHKQCAASATLRHSLPLYTEVHIYHERDITREIEGVSEWRRPHKQCAASATQA